MNVTRWSCEKAGTGLANGKAGCYVDGKHDAGVMRISVSPSMITPHCFGWIADIDGAKHAQGAVIAPSMDVERLGAREFRRRLEGEVTKP